MNEAAEHRSLDRRRPLSDSTLLRRRMAEPDPAACPYALGQGTSRASLHVAEPTSLHCLPAREHAPPTGPPTTARESNTHGSLAIEGPPTGILTARMSQKLGAKEGLGLRKSLGCLTVTATNFTIRCRLHERSPPGAIIGLGFRASHGWRASQGRIAQHKHSNGADADPRGPNQHGHDNQETPLPVCQPQPARAQKVKNCDGFHGHHSVPIHELSTVLPLTTVHVSAPPFRCCSTQRRV